MANTSAAKKAMRASARRAVRNRATKSAVKTGISRARKALVGEPAEQAQELAGGAIAGLDRAASKGILHRNNAARRKARLQRRVNAALAGQLTQEPTKGTRGRAAAEKSAKPAKAAAATKKPAAKRTNKKTEKTEKS